MRDTSPPTRSQTTLGRILPPAAASMQHSELLCTLRSLGADQYDLHLPETHYLPQLLKPHEKLLGVLYGRYRRDNGQPVGRGLLAATDERLLFVDRKPFYMHFDELVYAVVSGVAYTHVGLSITVAVSTRMGTISFRTFNRTAARYFVAAVERMLFKQQRKGVYDSDYR